MCGGGLGTIRQDHDLRGLSHLVAKHLTLLWLFAEAEKRKKSRGGGAGSEGRPLPFPSLPGRILGLNVFLCFWFFGVFFFYIVSTCEFHGALSSGWSSCPEQGTPAGGQGPRVVAVAWSPGVPGARQGRRSGFSSSRSPLCAQGGRGDRGRQERTERSDPAGCGVGPRHGAETGSGPAPTVPAPGGGRTDGQAGPGVYCTCSRTSLRLGKTGDRSAGHSAGERGGR